MLRVSRERIFLYGILLIAVCLVQVRFVVAQNFGDWSAFWAAAATAGTPDLLDPHRHAVWQQAHHELPTIFPYLPGAAWLLEPLKTAPLWLGYSINFGIMALSALIAALIAARVYRVPRALAVLLTFAWAPVTAALSTGQNAPLGLLLSMCAIASLAANSGLGAGLAIGALLYKPLYALPFIVLLVLKGNWRALGVATACAALWYVVSVAATAGDWAWPVHYAAALEQYAHADAQVNAVKAISVPQLLLRMHLAPQAAYGFGIALFAIALPFVARMRTLEAASFILLLALAVGPHTLPYDLTLAVPAILFFTSNASEPVRTRVVVALFLLAPLWLLSGVLKFDVLAVLCLGLTFAWLWHDATVAAQTTRRSATT